MLLDFTILKFLIAILLILSVIKLYTDNVHYSILHNPEPEEAISKELLIATSGCSIPKLNPFSRESAAIFEPHNDSWKCTGKPNFINIISHDRISLNKKYLTRFYRVRDPDLNCTYQEITKHDEKDSYQFGEVKILDFNNSLKEEYIWVECIIGVNKTINEYVSLLPRKKILEERYKASLLKSSPDEPLNVVILGIDSISKLNFLRHFSETYNYLKYKLEAIELNGYSKISDNSFPNLVPFLTGHHYTDYWEEGTKSKVYFDDSDFIWKHYKNRGYRTLYAEDMTRYGTFNFNKKRGFKGKPVDYYYRPMSAAMENSDMAQNSKSFCFNAMPMVETIWDYLRRYIRAIKYPYLSFSFTFVSKIVHGHHNHAGYLDYPLVKLLKGLDNSGVLNRSILILFSDHGIRVGHQRQTFSGAYEERMPMCFMIFPKWFKTKYPDVYRNLKVNENRLTTHFDIHSTLFHFLNFTKAPPTNKAYKYGISLFSEIPENRTCEDAGINNHWCPCKLYTPLKEASIVNYVTNIVLRQINKWLSKNEKCIPLSINEIIRSSSYEFSKKDSRTNIVKHFTDYLVAFQTTPGDGMFESTIRYDKNEETYTIMNEICRINNYGKFSYCVVEGEFIFKYCQCM